ncbi:MAG: hypothetical protein ACREMY_24345 [bacterium]
MPKRRKPEKRIRVRSKALSQIDETKLALAFWLMAKRLVEEQDEPEAGETPSP